MKTGDRVNINGTINVIGHPWTCPICGFVMSIGRKECEVCNFNYFATLMEMEMEND
jgi:hypothetical protein